MAVRPTYAQLEKLVEYMKEKPQLARRQLRSNVGRFESKRKWEELARILNSMEGLKQDANQWSQKRKKERAEQPKQHTVATLTTQMKALSLPRRNRRIRVRSRGQMHMEMKRLIKIEERRVANEAARAVDLLQVCQALQRLGEAIALCGETIAEALRSID